MDHSDLVQLQQDCPHGAVIEVVYYPSCAQERGASYRLCQTCGLSERKLPRVYNGHVALGYAQLAGVAHLVSPTEYERAAARLSADLGVKFVLLGTV